MTTNFLKLELEDETVDCISFATGAER